MKRPIEVCLDLKHRVGYVRYGQLDEGEHLTACRRLEDPNGDDLDVVADYGVNGVVVGIELLGFDPRTLDVARSFATQHGLAFPDLAAALTAVDE